MTSVIDLLPSVLSRTEWKRVPQISRDLAELVSREPQSREVADAEIFLALRSGQEERWIESREVTVPKSLLGIGGKRLEFRLTGIGRRKPEEEDGILDELSDWSKSAPVVA